MTDNELDNLSVTAMLEWVGCDAFRERTTPETLLKHTSIGTAHFDLKQRAMAPGAAVTTFDELVASRRRIQRVLDHMVHKGWLKPSARLAGRPRTRVFTDAEELQAIGRYENRGDYRSQRLTQAQPTTFCYVTLTDAFYGWLCQGADTLQLEGLTRDQIATRLGISRKLTNRLVRELRKHGFTEVRSQVAGCRQRVLTKVAKNG